MTDELRATMRHRLEQDLRERARMRRHSAAPPPPAAQDDLTADLLRLTATALGMAAAELDPTAPLACYGIDSIAITEVMGQIAGFLGVPIAPTVFFEASTLGDLIGILRARHPAIVAARYAASSPAVAADAAEPPPDVDAWIARHRAVRRHATAAPAPRFAPAMPEIAIVAMDGVFADSADIDALEAHLRRGEDCITEIPPSRWDWRAVDGDPRHGPRTRVHFGGFVPGHDAFDAGFFGLSPREAELIDPQHRMVMHCVWRLIEASGHAPRSLAGHRVGVFLGINLQDYADLANRAGAIDPMQLTGLGHAFCVNRLSFLLDLRGPSQVIDTACSSSLVALHRAVLAIRHEGCEMAIAGGANLMLTPTQHILFSRVGMLAPDGRCKAFGQGADGYGRADGVGAVLLKRLDLAERDGDPVLAIIRGTAENHGGAGASLTAPNPAAQARLLLDAYHQAGIDPRSVGLVECHGTGTRLSDPVEIEGLKTAFAALHAERGLPAPATPYCGIGSVKSTIGHAETAAGVAGVIKALLALRHATRYRSLHCAPANPLIDLSGSPFFLLDAAHDWPAPVIEGQEHLRRAGVSSFGAGGANAHVVLEEYRPAAAPAPLPGPHLIALSARDDAALMRMVERLAGYLDRTPATDLASLAYTLQVGRDPMRTRLAMVVDTVAALRHGLAAILAGARNQARFGTARKDAPPAPAATPLATLATLWVEGAAVDWPRLHAGRTPCRLALPAYPFAQTCYWLPQPSLSHAAPGLEPAGPERWRTRLDPAAFYLRDHLVGGVPVLPGVVALELLHQAARHAGLAPALRQVVWLAPLEVQTPRDVEINLRRDGVRPLLMLETRDPDGTRRLHAQAAVDPGPAIPEPGLADLASIEATLPGRLPIDDLYRRCAAMGLSYGPAHRAVTALFHAAPTAQPAVLARLRLPDGIPLDGFILHPSLLDGAFQSALGLAADAADNAGLPFALDRIDILRPCTASMAVHIRATVAGAGQRLADLDLFDADGALCVRMRGFATRAQAASLQAATHEADPPLLHVPAWVAVPGPTEAPAFGWRTVLLCSLPAADALRALQPGWRCLDSDAPADDFAAHAQALLAMLQDPRPGAGLVQIVIPQGTALAGLLGMLQTARQELPGLAAQLIERPPSASPATLAACLDAAASHPHLAHLSDGPDGLLTRAWLPLPLPHQLADTFWRDGAVSLITGGLGGIGRLLAHDIVDRSHGAVLVLAGRTPPDAAAAAWIASLHGVNGATVTYLAADIADAGSTAGLIDAIRQRHGRLDAVLHAAGITRDGALDAKTPATLAAVLAPKVAGTRNLDCAIGPGALKLFLLFGSLAGVVGNAGQADYAAANGFLDAFAAQRETRRAGNLCQGRTVAIDWPLWQTGGIRMTAAAARMMHTATGLAAISTPAALAALAQAVGADAPQVLVAAGDPSRIARLLNPPAPERAAPASAASRHTVLVVLEQMVAAQLKVAPTDLAPEIELTEYGFDSISFTLFANALNDRFDLSLTPMVFFEHTTLDRLAAHLAGQPALAPSLPPASPAPLPPAEPVLLPTVVAQPAAKAGTQAGPPPIAIIGLSGRFPGAPTADALWQVLHDATDCIGLMPAWRRTPSTPLLQGGFIDGIDQFDPAFFGVSAAEARMMDPQQRLLLTLAWRLFEDAGIAPRSLWGAPVGVFIGVADTGYGRLLAASGASVEAKAMTGLAPSVAPNRISFHFNLTGPSAAVETACSSALVAIHRAVAAIRAGECTAAIAGGINALLLPDAFEGFAKAGMLAPDGRSKSFAASANGYGRGEGGGLVLLKPLADAERDGDCILAVIRASAEGHGGRAASLTAPNPAAQADLLRRAYTQAGFDPRTVTYIEAHGTGTPLGDPIEVEALRAAFAGLARDAETRFGAAPPMRCGLGSVKSNIGHLELAAGIAGVAKVLLQLRHATLAQSLHCADANPLLALGDGPFHLVQQAQPWVAAQDAAGRTLPRRAGISSFGFGGSNAHLVLEEYAAPAAPPPASAGPCLVVLSARTAAQLDDWVRTLADAVPGLPSDVTAADIAGTLQAGRDAMEHRLAFVCHDRAGLQATLDAIVAGRGDGVRRGQVRPNHEALALLDSDAAIRAALAGLPARGRHDLLLDLWVRGFAFDWRALHPTPARRVRLPGLPLAETSHWVHSPAAVSVPAMGLAAAPAPAVRLDDSLDRLTSIAADLLEAAPADLDPDSPFGEFGFDSIGLTTFARRVNEALGTTLTPADLFEFATLSRLAQHIGPGLPAAPSAPAAIADPAPAPADDPIAIVGLSCCFPGAHDADAFWRNLHDGVDAITEIPPARWDWRAIDGDPKRTPGRTNSRWGGFIDEVFAFDPLFFGISPREARSMDPQQRLMLMHAWKAIEDAGHDPRSLAGGAVGVFVATAASGYLDRVDAEPDGHAATGTVPSVGPNRISYFLDLHGPSEPIETACSSSLVAVHRAVQAIAAGDCEMALAGGVNTMVTPAGHLSFSSAGMLSPDGRCATFSAHANGYVRGEGVGMLFLKRLSAARRDGDPVHAVIRGSAINHGGRANALTAPNTDAQAAVLRRAYAGLDVATIGYIEAHGTGTALGDPVEIRALTAAFAALQPAAAAAPWCGLGSVKTGIGHLELAAGVAGIVKVVLQMRHRTLAPSLHATPPNPYIALDHSPFFIVRDRQPWPAPRNATDVAGVEGPRRAGVSSFGFGGVNAHVVLEDAPPRLRPSAATGPALVVLSAHDPARLHDQARDLLAALDTLDPSDIHDLAYTLQVGRAGLRERLAIVADTPGELRDGLRAILADQPGQPGRAVRGTASSARPAMPHNSDFHALAAHWVQGGAVDWTVLHVGRTPRRLRLPTYPFSQEPPRIEPATLLTAEPGVIALDAHDPLLRDHRVQGACIVPAAMILALAHHAVARPVCLRQVVWLKPVAVPPGGGAALRLVLAEDAGATRFSAQVGVMAGPGEPHAQGVVEDLDGTDAPPLDYAAIAARCLDQRPAVWLYDRFAARGLDYGPAYRTVGSLRTGPGEVLAELRLPAVAASRFALHPAMLDGAFQACLGLGPVAPADGPTDGTAVPFALDRLDILAPTTDRMWAHARSRPGSGPVRRLDIDLADADGTVCVRVRGLAVRLLPAPRPTTPGPAASRPIASPSGDLRAAATSYLVGLLSEATEIDSDTIEPAAPLEAYGIDSILITRLTDRLEQDFGPLSKTLFFEHGTLAALVDYFCTAHPARLAAVVGTAAHASDPIPVLIPVPTRYAAPHHEPIAIVGLAGRYPGAPTLAAFWDNLAAGRDSITEIPSDRWDHSRLFDPVRGQPGKTNSKWGGFIDGFDRFDALFFNIAPREADFMDPQERLFLQCAWECLEDSGHTRASLASEQAGVFVGVMYSEYQLFGAERSAAGEPMALGASAASIANRVSYVCGLDGPSLAVDSMCSSSLTAIHLACESLRAGGCTVALAGGVNLTLHPNKYLTLAQGRFTSSTGRCESFGRGGDGYVPGEGVGAVLLKPLSHALADGDRIYATIRGSALNHGGKTNGYTVPNPAAQTAVITRALNAAGVRPQDIGYVEAHGTGTVLGDPIEANALAAALQCHPTPIGSVKSNIGHCESAAGIAGLTKVLLQMRHGQLAPSLHAETLNPGIDFQAAGLRVQRCLEPWPRPDGGPRIAGLSSFGAGGSNAHFVIQEHVAAPPPAPVSIRRIFPFSARDEPALRSVLRRFLDADVTDLEAAACVLQEGREAFEQRLAIVADDRSALTSALQAALSGQAAADLHCGRRRPGATLDPATRSLDAIAAGWVTGAPIDWAGLRGAAPARRVGLPTYPFVGDRHWFSPAAAVTPAAPVRLPLLFAPVWRDRPATADLPPPDRTLVVLCGVADPSGLDPAEVSVLGDDAAGAEAMDPAARLATFATAFADILRSAQPGAGLLVQLVVAQDPALPEALAGMLRTACLEHPGLRGQTIALDPAVGPLAPLLHAERRSADTDIRHHGACRSVRLWTELVPPAASSSPWKDGGVYLITGGSGGVAHLLCAEIARSVRRPVLVLASRSGLAPTSRATLDALDATVVHHRCDVTDAVAVAALVANIGRDHGRLNGVVHAAGLIRDRALAGKTADDIRAVLAPKVAGAMNLDAATAGLDLDVMLLFGSAAGVFGNPGQADYATANAFLDAFATLRASRPRLTLAIDWPYWREGGMHMPDAAVAAMDAATGSRPLETAAAMAALSAALSAAAHQDGLAQILVLDGDHARLRAGMAPRFSLPAAPSRPRSSLALVRAAAAAALHIEPGLIDADETFDRYGMDSVTALILVETLARTLGPLPDTLALEHPTLTRLAAALDRLAPPVSQSAAGVGSQPAPSAPTHPNDIAIIAVAGRYPGADTVDAFWDALQQGRDLVTEIPLDRWDHDAIYQPGKGRPGRTDCRWGGFLSDVDRFDAAFFGIPPRDAARMDPQERLFLETVWRLLEAAGHTRAHLRAQYAGRVGVYAGAMYRHYQALATDPDDRALLSLGTHAALANRVSFFFDLQGPSVAVDAMCASGLQAVHLACQGLLRGECGVAIAGAVNLSLHPDKYLGLSRAGLLGSTADSRSFADGDGYLPAEGVGAVLLKPLADALRDGDDIIAVIKASAANHAGHSAGYGVPSLEAQARLIEDNLRVSGVDPRSIGYAEAAATGAPMADAIELRAAAQAFRAFTSESGFCAIGSVKSNMGHAEAASGLAQLTKVMLQLRHRRLVPSVRAERLNPALVTEGTPFRLQTGAGPWLAYVAGGVTHPLRATVSAFGAGGSNVHLVLEEAPGRPAAPPALQGPRRFVVSAGGEAQLHQVVADLAAHIRSRPGLCLARLATTLRDRRERMACVAEIAADGRDDLLARLDAWPSLLPPPLGAPIEDAAMAPPLDLPPYPLHRERHWLNTAATPAIGPATIPSLPDAKALILQLLAAETGHAGPAPDTRFRDLGATSMFALRLIRACADQLGAELTHRDIDAHPTPRALAAHLTRLIPPAGAPTAAPPTIDGPAPLSQGQAGLWALQALHPGTGAYNVPLAFAASGLDADALHRSVAALAERFPILATRVHAIAGVPHAVAGALPAMQRVAIPAAADRDAFARSRVARPFDLAADPPLRCEWLHRDASGDLVLLVIHHIAIDGLSAVLVGQAFWDLYERFAAAAALPFPSPAAAYPAFVAWEQAFLASPRAAAQRAYWVGHLASPPPALDLPGVAPPDAARAFEGRHLERQLPPALAQATRRTAARLGINPSVLFLGALQVLLSRLCDTDEILVGMPVIGRPERRFEASVGLFANVVAIRTRIEPAQPAAMLLAELQRRVNDGLDHAFYPYAALCRELGSGGQSLHQVGYAYRAATDQPLTAPRRLADGAEILPLPHLRQEGDSLFALEVTETAGTTELLAVYNPSRLADATVGRMLDQFTALLEALCRDPAAPVATLDLLDAAQTAQLTARLAAWSRGPPLPDRPGFAPGLAHDWIVRLARRRPWAAAVRCDGAHLRFGALMHRAHRLSAHLREQGAGPGARVGVLLGRDPDSIVALLATLGSGAAWVPLDPGSPNARLAQIAGDCGFAVLVTDTAHEARARALGHDGAVVRLDADAAAIRAQGGGFVACDPDSPAYIIHTSGSTGRPKGVVVSHAALAAHCRAVIQRYALTPADRVLQFAQHDVDTALEQIVPTLACGASLVMRGDAPWSPADLARSFATQRVTVADLPPAYLQVVLQSWNAGSATASPRLVIAGGEAMPPALARAWPTGPFAAATLLNAYGPTEATITACVHRVDPAEHGAIPIGRPLPGVVLRILDRGGHPVPEGVPGELHIGGHLALGYHGQPSLTQAAFIPDRYGPPGARLYRTGDRAMFLPGRDGLIGFLGRLDRQVQIRGFRVELGDVEAALGAAGAPACAVVPGPSSDGATALIAFVAAPAGLDTAGLAERAAQRLPPAARPARIVRLDALPVTLAGKVDRQALAVWDLDVTLAATATPAVRDPIEARLLALWREVLGPSAVFGPDDDFFAVGGHSLLAMRLAAALQQEYGHGLTIARLIEAPTIAAQARLLRGAAGGAASRDTVVSLRPGGTIPVFCLHPAGGSVACYVPLARALGPALAVYGLQSPALDAAPDAAGADDLQTLAAHHAAAIRRVQPNGPYRLLGWSVGGTIAFEVARQLQAQHHIVQRLILLDAYAPATLTTLDAAGPSSRATSIAAFAHDLAEAAGLDPDTLFTADEPPADVAKLLGHPSLYDALAGFDAARLRQAYGVFAATLNALRAYRPAAAAVPTTLFRAAPGASPVAHGWHGLIDGGLRLRDASGQHGTMLAAPHVAVLARRIDAELAEPARERVSGAPRLFARMIARIVKGRHL